MLLVSSLSFAQTYTDIDYIESTSDGAYINTGYIHKTNTRIEMECNINSTAFPNNNSNNAILFGSRKAAFANAFMLFAHQQYQTLFYGTFDCPDRKQGTAKMPTDEKVKITASHDDGVKIYRDGESEPAATIAAPSNDAQDGTCAMYIFALNNNGTTQWYSHMKLYSFKIYEGETLVHSYVPKLKKEGGVKTAVLYDTIEDVYLESAGSAFSYPEVPATVVSTEPVRYIESANASAAPYINTGYCPTANTTVKMTYNVNNVGSGNRILFGTVTVASPLTNAFTFWQYLSNNDPFDFGYGNDARGYSNALAPWGEILYFESGTDGNATITTGYGDGYRTTYPGNAEDNMKFDGSIPIYIFARNTGGAAGVFGYMKLFSFQIYESGVLQHDYVPVAATMDDDTTVGALKDLVTGDILTSANTNALTYSSASENTFSLPLTDGYCTFSDARPYTITTEGVKAYRAASSSGGWVTVEEIGSYIPANTGVLLYGEGASNVTLTVADEAEAVASNLMKPYVTAHELATTDGDNTNYILVKEDGKIVFAPSSGSGTLAARKAYLQLPTSAGAKILISFGDETGINEELTVKSENTAPVYNLQGQRVAAPTKGIFIQNGKKFLVK